MSANTTRSEREAVLITGAAGYIGGLVTAALAARPEGIRRIVAADVRAPAERLPGVTYLTLDVRSPELSAVLEQHRIDTVVHLAAIVTPGPGQSRQLQYSVDVEGTGNVLRACVARGVRKLIVTSSGAAYGYHADNASYLDEESPLRGNEAFAYAHHKRLVEQMLADYRERRPRLQQLVFRVGTILGASVSNQITALFEKPVVLGLSGVSTPFVFIWDGDVVACIEEGIHTDKTGVFNLAGDGAVTLREIALRLGKPYVQLPERLVAAALAGLRWLGRTQYGPEQVGFLKHRPVLLNRRLKQEFGYRPRYTSREVFELYRQSTGG
jgi:UDP-glucose 4-epimerase